SGPASKATDPTGYQLPPPPPPAPPPENPPPENPLEPVVDGGVDVSVPDVDTVKPSIALEKARNVNGVVEMYQDDVSGGWSSKPPNAAARGRGARNAVASGGYAENSFFFSARRARSFSAALRKGRKPSVRRQTAVPLAVRCGVQYAPNVSRMPATTSGMPSSAACVKTIS